MRSPSSRGVEGGGGGGGKKAEASPCCTKVGLKRGPWTAEEDELLADYIKREGEGRWRTLPNKAGLLRCGKSCRLRWMNYLRPSLKRGHISPDEEDLILRLHRLLGNRWSLIAGRIPGRTDNEIKNYWNTHLSKKLISQGIDPKTHKPLNPNPSIDNMKDSSSEAVVHNSLSNPYYAPLASENVIINNVQLGEGNMYSHQYADDQNGLKKDLGNSDEGMSHEDAGDDMINCCPDDAFSSFLNSLINDDMFNNQHQDQQEQYHPAADLNSNKMIPPIKVNEQVRPDPTGIFNIS